MTRRQLSIRSMLLLTAASAMVLSLMLVLVYRDASRDFPGHKSTLDIRSELLSMTQDLGRAWFVLTNEPGIQERTRFLQELSNMEAFIKTVNGQFAGESAEEVAGTLSQIGTTLDRLAVGIPVSRLAGEAMPEETLARMSLLSSQVSVLDGLLAESHREFQKTLRMRLLMAFLANLILVLALLLVVYIRIHHSLTRLTRFTEKLSAGELPGPLPDPGNDEFGLVTAHLNALSGSLEQKMEYVSTLSSGGKVSGLDPGERDALGKALRSLSVTLSEKEVEENARNREDKRQNWISGGMARLGDILRTETENITELSFLVIQNLVKYMEVEMGSMYLTGKDREGKPFLELSAAYAYDRRKYLTGRLEWGEGLPGTCAQEGQRIFLTEVPEDYFEIRSGTGSLQPNCLLLVPMIIQGDVRGVIELATVKLLRPFEIEFVESMAESVASALRTVENNMRNRELLQQSQEQSQELREKEEAMMESMKKLEEARTESLRKESELTGILNAMNQSVLVAELGMNRRYTAINEPFLSVLGFQKDQVLGKLHSEVAEVDPYSEDYKAFWESLKQGSPARVTELYHLHSGKELWLEQSYTPISNEAGKVHKVLSLATDVTELRVLQQKLEASMAEVTRSQLDMQTLSEAVNSSLIKCELDAEGVIMSVNDNYVQVSGYSRKELLGRSYRLFLKEPEKEQFEKIWAELTKQKVYEGVIRRTRPTGEETWLVSTFSPVADESGEIRKVYFLGLDITEKKLKYQLLEEANLEIERLKARLKELEI